jgi:hypothetical protein
MNSQEMEAQNPIQFEMELDIIGDHQMDIGLDEISLLLEPLQEELSKEQRKELRRLKRQRKAEREARRKTKRGRDEDEEAKKDGEGEDREKERKKEDQEKKDEEKKERVSKIRRIKRLPQEPTYNYVLKPVNPKFAFEFSNLSAEEQGVRMEKYNSDLLEYNSITKKNYEVRKAWLAAVVKEEKDISYQERTKVSLERELELRGLDTKGSREIMIQRLMKHDINPDDCTITRMSMKVVEKVTDVTLFSEHQPQVYGYGSGEDRLLSLPHGIIQRNLLPYFNVLYPKHYYALFGLLTSCKYLQEDVLAYLTKEAKRVFGEGGTPLALSFYFKTVWNMVRRVRTRKEKKRGVSKYKFEHVRKLTIAKVQDKLGFSQNWHKKGIHPTQVDAIRQASSRGEMVLQGIKLCITVYGSMEGYRNHLEKTKQLKINRENDKKMLLQGAYKRAEDLNNALDKIGYPEMVRCAGSGLTTTCEKQNLHVWNEIYADYKISNYNRYFDLFSYVKGHILRSQPSTLKAVLSKFEPFLPDYFSQIKQIAKLLPDHNDAWYFYGYDRLRFEFLLRYKYLFIPKNTPTATTSAIKWYGETMSKEVLDNHFAQFSSVKFNELRDHRLDFGLDSSFFSHRGETHQQLFIVFDNDLSLAPQFHLIDTPLLTLPDNVRLCEKLGMAQEQLVFQDPVTGSENQKRVIFAKIK